MRIFFRDNFSPAAAAPAGRRRGSALLIVLGFLSFMIISAVSFAIYMRIERQASSNYRHSVTARHLLNAGLFRAIEEIDSELRLTQNGVVKFPKEADWPGRVKVSARTDDDEVQKAQDARVLSIESLSYLPAFLVNDVRRYAVRDEKEDNVWKGAKWRPLKRLKDEDIIGRYAYVCVNVSDMLDVNLCKAAKARDSFNGRVSLGHLVADGQAFDDDVEKAVRCFSLHDFYEIRKGQIGRSPYHDYLNSGYLTEFGKEDNSDHVFTTDSIVRPEPTNSAACNILLNPPFSATLMANRRPNPGQLVFDSVDGRKPFWEALKASPRNTTLGNLQEQMMAAMIKDYLDTDEVPSLLNVPCVERVPMVSQLVIKQDTIKYKIDKKEETKGSGATERKVTVYTVQLLDGAMPLYVEMVWPFKYANERTGNKPTFDLEIDAYLALHKEHVEKKTTDFPDKNIPEIVPLTMVMSKISGNNFFNKVITTENECYTEATATLQADKAKATFEVIDSDGEKRGGFGTQFSVSLIVFARIKSNGSSEYVDSVPQYFPYPGVQGEAENLWQKTPKLFFQTKPINVAGVVSTPPEPQPYAWDWSSLEVADPRFNYKASNWVKNNETEKNYCAKNPSTKKLLEDGKGRDADIFMSVSDAGFMQSPGELGFIVRPFPMETLETPWDFRVATEPKDAPYMFRTFRLYDHGSGDDRQRDNVYGHFYVMKADGTLPGARVNPLSDISKVREAAIWGTPLDYWIAATNNALTADDRKRLTYNTSPTHFNKDLDKWEDFLEAWERALDKVTPEVNKEWKTTLSDLYGNWDYFQWYDTDPELKREKIFERFSLGEDKQLHEVDRKMLYSFSLDSFSDRQQLFLYILRAEATVPSFGGGADSGMRSLAGGRAVALVWRDPYPRGYRKTPENWNKKAGAKGWYPTEKTNIGTGFVSPWERYGSTTITRWDGYHDTRILFFKQLDK